MWGPATSPSTDTEGRLYWLWSETHQVQIPAPPCSSSLPAFLSLSFFTCKNLIISRACCVPSTGTRGEDLWPWLIGLTVWVFGPEEKEKTKGNETGRENDVNLREAP